MIWQVGSLPPVQGTAALSIQEKVGRAIGLLPHQVVQVGSCLRETTALDRVEVTITDGCLPRQEMWRFLQNLQNHFVYVNQCMNIDGCEVSISGLTKGNTVVYGGLINSTTDVLFLRNNCRMYVVIHITRDILAMDHSGYLRGEIVTDFCMKKIQELWKRENTHHLITVLLYMSKRTQMNEYLVDLDGVYQGRVYPQHIPFIKVERVVNE